MAEADIMPIEAAGISESVSVGVKLAAAREAMGLTAADVSKITKINQRHIAAVEAGDFAALPARLYAVGFARSYAGAVGLDPAAIAGQVRRELDGQESLAAVRREFDLDLEDPAKVPSKRLAWVSAALALGLVAAGTVYWRSYYVPAVDLPAVGERALAGSALAAPVLTPAAMVSPTAESAAGIAVPLDPAPEAGTAPARPAARGERPKPAAAAPVEQAAAEPAPAPAEPAGQAAAPVADAAPASVPPAG